MNPRIAVTFAMALAACSIVACAGKDEPKVAAAGPAADVRDHGTGAADRRARTTDAASAAPADSATAAAPPLMSSEPRQRTLGLLASLIRVKQVPDRGPLSTADKEANRKLFTELDDYFDFDRMIHATIGPHAGEFDEEQLAQFNAIFAELVRLVAYPRSGGFLRACDTTIGKAHIDGKMAKVQMHAVRHDEDLEMDVAFYWENQGRWRLVDVAFDGAPLTKEYQNRIGRVIEEDGVSGLLRKIEKRRREELRVVQ